MSSPVKLFPLGRAAEMYGSNKGNEVGDLSASYMALASLYEATIEELEELRQALEVAAIRLGFQSREPEGEKSELPGRGSEGGPG